MDIIGAQQRHRDRVAQILEIAREAELLSCGPDAGWYEAVEETATDVEVLPEAAIALVGPTGVGKSTLVNAILGRRLLPVSSSQVCTAAVTEVRASEDDRYHVTVDFVPEATWKADRDTIVEDLTQAYVTDGEIGDDLAELEARLRAVYGDALDRVTRSTTGARSRLRTPPLIQEALDDRRRVFVTGELELARRALADHLDARRPFWPVVRRVTVAVPDCSFDPRLTVVDLPGVNDANAAREATTRTALGRATGILVVFHTRRGLTRDVQLLCEHPDLRGRVLDGRLDEIAFVGTGLDDIDLAEDADRFDQPVDDRVAVALARADDVRANVATQMADLALRLTRRRPAATDAARDGLRDVPVMLVSSTDHLALASGEDTRVFDDPGSTGVGGLHDHLDATMELAARRWNESLEQRITLLIAEVYELVQRRRTRVAVVDDGLLDKRISAAARVESIVDDLSRHMHEVVRNAGDTLEAAIEASTDDLASAVGDQSPLVAELARHWGELPSQALRTSVRRSGRLRRRDRRIELDHDVADVLAERLRPAWRANVVEPLVTASGEIARALVAGVAEGNRRIGSEIGDIDHDLIEQIGQLGRRTLHRFDALVADLHDRTRRAGEQQLTRALDASSRRTTDHFRFAITEAKTVSGRGRADRIVELLLDHAAVTLSTEAPHVVAELGEASNRLLGSLRLELDELAGEAADDLTRIVDLIADEDRPVGDRTALDELLGRRTLLSDTA